MTTPRPITDETALAVTADHFAADLRAMSAVVMLRPAVRRASFGAC